MNDNLDSSSYSGFIFFWNRPSIKECLDKKVLGTGKNYSSLVRNIKEGQVGFLYDYDADILYGTWEAISTGGTLLVNDFCTGFRGVSIYPSQVKVKRINAQHIHHAREKLSKPPYSQFILRRGKYVKTTEWDLFLKYWQVQELQSLLNIGYTPDECRVFLDIKISEWKKERSDYLEFVEQHYGDCSLRVRSIFGNS